MTLSLYRLKATLGKTRRINTFYDTDDTRAIGRGAMIVMRLAHHEFDDPRYPNKVWGKGKILLLNSTGETLQTMDAKE